MWTQDASVVVCEPYVIVKATDCAEGIRASLEKENVDSSTVVISMV